MITQAALDRATAAVKDKQGRVPYDKVAEVALAAAFPQVSTVADLEAVADGSWLLDIGGAGGFMTAQVDAKSREVDVEGQRYGFEDFARHFLPMWVAWSPDPNQMADVVAAAARNGWRRIAREGGPNVREYAKQAREGHADRIVMEFSEPGFLVAMAWNDSAFEGGNLAERAIDLFEHL